MVARTVSSSTSVNADRRGGRTVERSSFQRAPIANRRHSRLATCATRRRLMGSRLSLCACMGTMNPPLTPPRRGTFAGRTTVCSPLGRGRGWVGYPENGSKLLISKTELARRARRPPNRNAETQPERGLRSAHSRSGINSALRKPPRRALKFSCEAVSRKGWGTHEKGKRSPRFPAVDAGRDHGGEAGFMRSTRCTPKRPSGSHKPRATAPAAFSRLKRTQPSEPPLPIKVNIDGSLALNNWTSW